jgi:hypothetical protein
MLENKEIIELIKDYLIDENTIRIFTKKINGIENKEKYRLEIGKVLYSNGMETQDYIVTPYNISVCKKNRSFLCEMSFCYGNEVNSLEYNSNRKQKKPVLIMNGYIFFIWGEFFESNSKINISRTDLLQWPTDIQLNELKKMVGWVSSSVEYHSIDFKDEKFERYNGGKFKEDENIKEHEVKVSNLGRIIIDGIENKPKENKGLLYIFENIPVHRLVCEAFLPEPIGFSSQIHHIDNNGLNNNIKNLLNLTYEQHASIHLFMWDKFKFENDILKNR